MGRPKHLLPFGDRTMLEHVVQTVRQVVKPVVVVRAPSMALPEFSRDILIAEDAEPGLGPLAGLAAGLAALQGHCRAAYVTSCDVPLLMPEVIRYLVQAAGEADAAIYRDGELPHVLAGVYGVHLLKPVQALLSERRLRPWFVVEQSDAHIVDVEDVRHLDPDLLSFRNINTPEDYAEILTLAGFKPPMDSR